MPGTGTLTLTGSGTHHLSDTGVTPTDVDYWINVFGPRIRFAGVAPRRTFKFVGWLQFYNSTFVAFTGEPGEAITPPLYFNSEQEDMPVPNPLASTATDFNWFVAVGCTVLVNVSYT